MQQMDSKCRYTCKCLFLSGLLWGTLPGARMTLSAQSVDPTRLPASGQTVKKAIYPEDRRTKSKVYNWLWGHHYRRLYTIPVTVPVLQPDRFMGGLELVRQAADFHGLLFQNGRGQYLLLRPLGGATSFLESDFFQEMYNKKDFKNTYMDEFIADSYTMINPYTFLVADRLAKTAGLISIDSRIYYIPRYSTRDTVSDGSGIQDKLVDVIEVPDMEKANIHSTVDLLDSLRADPYNRVDQDGYIRARLLDMMIGDWNKIPQNWNWLSVRRGDTTTYQPIVIDRNHAFTKVDGAMFKQMLSVLALGFIVNYDSILSRKNIKKLNILGFPLDMAVAARSDEARWIRQARSLQSLLTDGVIDEAFRLLPPDIRTEEMRLIREKLKARRDSLPAIARTYYRQLQRTPVLIGTDGDDRIRIDRYAPDSVRVSVYDRMGTPVFDRRYGGRTTKEIWMYGLDGSDVFQVCGHAPKNIPVYLISGPGENAYEVESGKKIRVYAYKDEKEQLDTIPEVKKIYSDQEDVHAYDYEKIKHHTWSFTPWGIYDTDKGITLGAFVTYTEYGFKRAPFTYRHRLGYNYLQGLMYQGVFPGYDGRKAFYLDAFVGSPQNFSNFFGFGNDTQGYKDRKRKFNRVSMHKYSLTPSFHLETRKNQELILYTSFNLYKAKRSGGRFVTQIYPPDSRIFKMNYFLDMGATYDITKNISSFLPKVEGALSAGWVMNLKDADRNFPYTQARLSWDMAFSDRFTWASMLVGKVLYNNKYEFYQAASIELRGFRENRFIGKQAFYQYSDFRLDMGKLNNPYIPLKYGLFAGFDYGRVWYPNEDSHRWHTSYGGGFWLTILNKFTTKYSFFGSSDTFRFMFELGMGF